MSKKTHFWQKVPGVDGLNNELVIIFRLESGVAGFWAAALARCRDLCFSSCDRPIARSPPGWMEIELRGFVFRVLCQWIFSCIRSCRVFFFICFVFLPKYSSHSCHKRMPYFTNNLGTINYTPYLIKHNWDSEASHLENNSRGPLLLPYMPAGIRAVSE